MSAGMVGPVQQPPGRYMTCEDASSWEDTILRNQDRYARIGCRRSIRFALLSLLLLMACEDQGTGSGSFSVVDSAGVTIVESTGPVWKGGEGWRVTPEPQVVIGIREGDERYLLDDVRGVRRLTDGRIAILDHGSYRVRVYDRAGTHLIDMGGEGDGPSEFRTPQYLGVVSDTLFVYEVIGGAMTWLSPDGQLLRTSSGFSQAERSMGSVHMFGHLETGYGIGTRFGTATYQPRDLGINRKPWSIWRFGLVTPGIDSLVSVPGGEVEILSSDGRGTHQRRFVFGKWSCLAVSKNRIYAGPTEEFSIQVYDGDGNLLRIIRRNEKPRRVTRSDFNQWVDQYLGVLDRPRRERAEMRRTASDLKVAETMPAFRWIGADSEENLWVEEWKGVGIDQGKFSVFGPDGVWLGTIELPDGLLLPFGEPDKQTVEIGSDYVLGVWSDDYGVEQVRLYGLEKN